MESYLLESAPFSNSHRAGLLSSAGNAALVALLVCGAVTACGCSSGASTTELQKPVHPVNGHLTVAGQPANEAFVQFWPVSEPPDAKDPRPRATVKDDGSFAISTYGSEDGAPVGQYVVTIVWSDSDNPDKLQGRYSDPKTSTLQVTVKEGSNDLPPYQF